MKAVRNGQKGKSARRHSGKIAKMAGKRRTTMLRAALWCALACGAAGTQQAALDKLAAQIAADTGTACTAPKIGSTTAGTGCTNFLIAIDAARNVVSLFGAQGVREAVCKRYDQAWTRAD